MKKAMVVGFVGLFVFAVLAVVAVIAYRNIAIVPRIESKMVSFDDFDMYPTPRTFDGPGAVFRVNREKKKFSVLTLNVKVENAGREAFPNQGRTTTWKLGAIADFLGDSKVIDQLKASGNADVEAKTEIVLGTGSRYRTFDQEIEKAVKDAQIKYHRDSYYYVVREAVAVKKVTIKMESKGDIDSNVEGGFKKLATAKAKTDVTLTNKSTLDVDFGNEELFIFYKSERLLPPGIGSEKASGWKVILGKRLAYPQWITDDGHDDAPVPPS